MESNATGTGDGDDAYGLSASISPTNMNSRYHFDSNSSFEINRKKRRLSGLGTSGLANDTLNNVSGESFSSTARSTQIVQSPWETRRMKADLIEARSRITVLKKEIEHQNTEMATTQLRNQHKISSLQQELSHATNKVTDLEKHLSAVRKREHAAREELVKARNQFNQLKQTADDQQFGLHSQIKNLEARYNCDMGSLNGEISDLRGKVMELGESLAAVQEELDATREINDTLQSKADAYDQTKRELDEAVMRAEEAESRVKNLEYEVGSYEDWKKLSEVSTSRLANCADLERENARLKEELKNLRGLIGNKLLLEEQVATLQTRLDRFTQREGETVALELRVKELESELRDWRQLGLDYSPKEAVNGVTTPTPAAIRRHIAAVLQKDVILTSEQSVVMAAQQKAHEAIGKLRAENEGLEGQLAEYKRSLKHYQMVLQRAQRKLGLIIGERDYMKQLIDSYEKDLTINQSIAVGQDTQQLQERIKNLEKVLANYQEVLQKLESEKSSSEGVCNTLTNEQYQKLRKEIDSLREENDMVRRRKQELELEIDQLRARMNVRIVRLTESPAEAAFELHRTSVEKLQAEIERLRSRIRALERGTTTDDGGQAEATVSNSNMTLNVMELNNLRAMVLMLEEKNQQTKDKYLSAALEFREVCYLLFGYRVDRVSNKNYRITSMYADSEEDYLNFHLDETSGKLNMLASRYGQTLQEQVDGQLGTHGSMPAFLSTLTLDLFKRTTIMVEAS
ncbi:mitotic spindle assembly checkpoint protein MAD1 isoform X2 [Anopheles bellator]|uniref:mitotic spindle assembly checkpoint protein MAD1 isoform X2 n=1 Tax=Anopheles bellator TaxID=139047 RepID=UPI00264A1C8D|nr:mitotic spindle assembly checkpoint protein MAD1 isoform X2 [Anopheles bellator]